MRESPTGSGNYAANLPPFGAYFKGVARVRTRFFAVTARTVDVTAGPVSGGTPVMFHLSSPLSISSAAFGDRAGSGLTKLNDQTYVVKTPPGVGTVDIAARTPSGARIPLGTFTYLGLERDPSSPDHGGVHGGNQVCVTGQNLGTRPIIAFDGVPAALPVRGADGRYCVKAPPGRGKVHVTAIASGGQSASFAYTYDGVMSDADYANEIAGHFLDLGLEGFEYGSLMNDAWEAFNLEGNGAGLAVFAARELVTRAGWWDLTGGPLDVPLDFATPLLFAGPEGVIAYLALTYAADKLNEAFEEACSDKLLEPVEQCIGAMFDVLIDPAGTIVDRSGRPVAGATATLTERTGPGSTFVPVPTDSGRISPNVNPQTAPSDGSFKWDAAAGTYRVEASSDQCTLPGGLPATAHTADLVLPPPVTGLVLVLPCDLSSPAPPSVDDVSPTLVEQSDGGDVLVSGSRLGAVDEVTVGGEEVSFMVLASGAIRAHVPANLQSGLEPVVASGPAGASSVTSASQIRVVATGPKNTGAPAVRFSALPPDDVPSDVATFAFEASDPDEPAGSLRLTCFIDGRLLDPCVSPVRLEGLAAGEHRFSVTATDSGNLSSDPGRTSLDDLWEELSR